MASNRFMNFTAGEGVEDADFRAMGGMLRKAMGQQAFQLLADANLLLANGSSTTRPPPGTTYDFGGGVASVGWGAYPIFPGIGASLTGTIGAGTLVVSTGNAGGDGPAGLDDDVPMAHVLEYAGQSLVIGANASGSTRYDIVTCPATDATLISTGDTESRDFEDGTTRVKSTTTPDKRLRLLSSGALTVTAGTPGAGIPSPTSGHAVLFVIEVLTGATTILIGGFTDRTIPIARGGLRFITQRGADGLTTGWGASGSHGIVSTGAASVTKFRPPQFLGDPAARLMGVCIHHEADEAFTADIVREHYFAEIADVTLLAVSPIGTTDGQTRTVLESPVAISPIWMNGRAGGRLCAPRDSYPGAPGALSSVGSAVLKVTSGTASAGAVTVIDAITWIVAA